MPFRLYWDAGAAENRRSDLLRRSSAEKKEKERRKKREIGENEEIYYESVSDQMPREAARKLLFFVRSGRELTPAPFRWGKAFVSFDGYTIADGHSSLMKELQMNFEHFVNEDGALLS